MGNSSPPTRVTGSNAPIAQNNRSNLPTNTHFQTRKEHIPLSRAASYSLDNLNQVFRGSPTDIYRAEGPINYLPQFKSSYQGAISNGNPNGKGVAHFHNGGYYAGDFVNGDAHGVGMYVYPNGSVYQGSFANSKFNGDGVLIYVDRRMKYEGNFVDGLPQGHGRQQYYDGGFYEGNFLRGEKNGQGIYTWANKNRYEGSFENGIMHGDGRLFDKSGSVLYSGKFDHGKKSGYGVFRTHDGVYEGTFDNDLLNGNGTFAYNDGKIYEGQFKDSMMHGNGRMYYTSNQVAEGYWQKNHNKALTVVKNEGSVREKMQKILARHAEGQGSRQVVKNSSYQSGISESERDHYDSSRQHNTYQNPHTGLNASSQVDPYRNQRVSEYA